MTGMRRRGNDEGTIGGLRRELLALLLVYGALAILPMVSGFACQGKM